MSYQLDFPKTLAAAAELLRREPGKQMSFLRLLKLLYIADRETLKENGYPMTGDVTVAMKHGPVLSGLYDIIKGHEARSAEFARYIHRTGYSLSLVKDPGIGELCKNDLKKLGELSERYRDKDDWEIVEETHEFPEWIKNNPGDSVRTIPMEDICEALGFESQRIERLKQHAEEVRQIKSVFQST